MQVEPSDEAAITQHLRQHDPVDGWVIDVDAAFAQLVKTIPELDPAARGVDTMDSNGRFWVPRSQARRVSQLAHSKYGVVLAAAAVVAAIAVGGTLLLRQANNGRVLDPAHPGRQSVIFTPTPDASRSQTTGTTKVSPTRHRHRRSDGTHVKLGPADHVVQSPAPPAGSQPQGPVTSSQPTHHSSPAASHSPSAAPSTVQSSAPTDNGTVTETVGGNTNTWTNYVNAGGSQGPSIPAYLTVSIACRVQGFVVADGNSWWYRIASSPWSDTYYASADAFYNNGATSGSLVGTPWVDPAVPMC